MTNHDEQMKAVARLVSGRPDWIDAPAVQAWHRSDGRTEHDGTPGKPRIWSPDYRTTERWSTPSLRNVHWSDLVDVVPLAAPAGSYTRTDEGAHIGPEGETDWHGLYLSENRRAEKAERERDEWEQIALAAERDADEAEENPHPLTPDAITDAMIERARQRGSEVVGALWDASVVEAMLTAALTEPPARPEGAEELARLIADADVGEWDCGDLANALLATGRVRVVTEEHP